MSTYTYTLDPSPAGVGTQGTGSGGILDRLPILSVIVVGGLLSVPGTSSAEPRRLWEASYIADADSTASGSSWALQDVNEGSPEATRRAISELRRISGLTWDQLGELFDVSRRSVHFWASGKALNATNEERLLRVLAVVREADRGDARSTRAALFDVADGATPFELLVAQRFDDARVRLGTGAGRPGPALAKLNAGAEAARTPLPPDELFDAQLDRVHREQGRGRAARTARNKRRAPA